MSYEKLIGVTLEHTGGIIKGEKISYAGFDMLVSDLEILTDVKLQNQAKNFLCAETIVQLKKAGVYYRYQSRIHKLMHKHGSTNNVKSLYSLRIKNPVEYASLLKGLFKGIHGIEEIEVALDCVQGFTNTYPHLKSEFEKILTLSQKEKIWK